MKLAQHNLNINVSYLALSVLVGVLLSRLLGSWYRKRHERRQARLHDCEPVVTLESRPWLFGLDTAYEMVTSYASGSRNQKLVASFEKYGLTFKTSSTDKARIFTIDPAVLKAVFGGSSDDWGVQPIRYEAFRPLFGDGVLATDGLAWKNGRRLAMSVIERIHKLYKEDLSPLDPIINTMLDLIPKDDSTIDLQPVFYQFTTDISTNNVFGQTIGAMQRGEKGAYGKEFLGAFLHCLEMVGERDEVPQWSHALWDRKFAKSCRTVQNFVEANLDGALALNEQGDEQSEKVSDRATADWSWAAHDKLLARDHIINVLAASFDTSAILLTNIIFHLARNPRCYAKLREEVLAFDGVPDSTNIKRLEYLQLVLKETLRLHGPASFNSRVALRDTVLPTGGGPSGTATVFVPEGDLVISSMYALQRRKDVWGDDAEQFRPERWDEAQPKTWDFMPFSGGQRVCPGQHLAQLQAAYVLFHFAKNIKNMENRDPVLEYVEEYHVATGSRNGALVACTFA